MAKDPENVGGDGSKLRLVLAVMRLPFAWLVMAISVGCTLVVIAGLAAGTWWLLSGLGWWDRGILQATRWDDWLVGGVGSTLVLVLGWFTFPLIVTAVAGVFLEPLADRLERKFYPDLPMPRAIPIAEQILISLRTLARSIGWNILCLPFYFIPVLNIAVYAAMNGFLLSREYFQVVALRHLPTGESKSLYRRIRWPLWRGGLVLSVVFVIPVVNLFAPLLATSWMVHRLWRGDGSPLRQAFAGQRKSGEITPPL